MKRIVTCLLIVILLLSASVASGVEGKVAEGRFEGEVEVRWLTDNDGMDRIVELLKEFSFYDSSGVKWTVPKGAKIDGASIPRFFWRTIGPPFVGDYRRASVVHDYYCETRSREWKAVHRMFYEACLAGGVSKKKAKMMYSAIYAGGPRWKFDGSAGFSSPVHSATLPDDKQRELGAWIYQNDPPLEEIESRIESEKIQASPY